MKIAAAGRVRHSGACEGQGGGRRCYMSAACICQRSLPPLSIISTCVAIPEADSRPSCGVAMTAARRLWLTLLARRRRTPPRTRTSPAATAPAERPRPPGHSYALLFQAARPQITPSDAAAWLLPAVHHAGHHVSFLPRRSCSYTLPRRAHTGTAGGAAQSSERHSRCHSACTPLPITSPRSPPPRNPHHGCPCSYISAGTLMTVVRSYDRDKVLSRGHCSAERDHPPFGFAWQRTRRRAK